MSLMKSASVIVSFCLIRISQPIIIMKLSCNAILINKTAQNCVFTSNNINLEIITTN